MPSVALTAPLPILFGKLPAHGDFIARNLSPSARGAWDAWASRELEAARAALGEAFEPAHESAPPRRFVLPPGPFGPHWSAGVIAPSVDAAGRRFVIVLAADRLEEAAAAVGGPALAAGLEDLVYQAFEQNMDADALIEAADEVVKHPACAPDADGDAAAPLAGDGGGLILEMLRSSLAEAQP